MITWLEERKYAMQQSHFPFYAWNTRGTDGERQLALLPDEISPRLIKLQEENNECKINNTYRDACNVSKPDVGRCSS